jgi:hypothetical protein
LYRLTVELSPWSDSELIDIVKAVNLGCGCGAVAGFSRFLEVLGYGDFLTSWNGFVSPFYLRRGLWSLYEVLVLRKCGG